MCDHRDYTTAKRSLIKHKKRFSPKGLKSVALNFRAFTESRSLSFTRSKVINYNFTDFTKTIL